MEALSIKKEKQVLELCEESALQIWRPLPRSLKNKGLCSAPPDEYLQSPSSTHTRHLSSLTVTYFSSGHFSITPPPPSLPTPPPLCKTSQHLTHFSTHLGFFEKQPFTDLKILSQHSKFLHLELSACDSSGGKQRTNCLCACVCNHMSVRFFNGQLGNVVHWGAKGDQGKGGEKQQLKITDHQPKVGDRRPWHPSTASCWDLNTKEKNVCCVPIISSSFGDKSSNCWFRVIKAEM